MRIRPLKITDYEQAYTLWEHSPGVGLTVEDDSWEGFERYLRRNPNSCFAAETAGKLAGTILAGHDGRRGYIYHLAVAEPFRRQGLGRELVRHAVAALRKEHICKIALVALEGNIPGNTFWESMGFSCRKGVHYRESKI